MESRIKRLFRSKSKKHKQEQGQKTQPQTLRSHHGRTDGAARADPLLRTSAYESLPARGEPLTGAYPLRGNGEGSAPILNGRQRALRQTHNGLGNPHRATKSDVAVPPLPPDMEDALKHHRQSASTGNLSNTMHRNGVPGMAFTTDKPEPLTNHGISRDVLTTASGNGDGQSRRRKPPPRQHVDLLLAAGLPHEYSAKAPPAPRNGNYNEAIADRNIENTSTAMPDHSKILNGDGHRVSSERKLPEETSKPLAAGQGAPVNSELASSLIERARNGESPPPRQSSRNQAELREKVDGDRSVRERPYSGVILSATPPGTRNVSSNQNDMLNKSLPPVPTTERENASVVSKNEPRATEKAEPSNTTSEVTRKPFPVQDGSKLPSLEGIVDLSNTVDTTVSERVAPAVTHETVSKKIHHSREEVTTREIHHHEVYHRIQPIIDVEVLPPRHFLPVEGGGLVEISGDNLPGRQGHWVIAETVSNIPSDEQAPDISPRFSARKFGPTEGETYKTVSPEGIPQTHQTWIHPPVLETEGMETGQTWPMTFEDTLPHRPKKQSES